MKYTLDNFTSEVQCINKYGYIVDLMIAKAEGTLEGIFVEYSHKVNIGDILIRGSVDGKYVLGVKSFVYFVEEYKCFIKEKN